LIKPEFPKDELARVSVLKSLSILDTKPEERFDRITRMAKRLFNMPIVLVSLVDSERQWFKSSMGLDAQETHRDISFCGHTILDDDIFVIENALEDERFADNPLVTGDPNIRFYAGCPIRSIAGLKLGTLCLIDKAPRRLSPEEKDVLRDLADMVERELVAFQVATTDCLTNITNRAGFLLLAERNLNACQAHGKRSSLLFLDLDKFKKINDEYGHQEGDKALSAFADYLRDTFDDSGLFARIGGDEFVVLLNDMEEHQTLQKVKALNESIARYNQQNQKRYNLSFCYGVVDIDPEDEKGISELLVESDLMMYGQKRCNTLQAI
jgi:diguanylate cyclase (GGDEF)-like protein